jgi:hypothetical protein
MRLLIAASALLLAATPGMAGGQRDSVPAATPNGKPVSCLRLSQVRETLVRDGRTIDFVTRGGQVYRNVLRGGSCPGLAFERRFAHQSPTGEYCAVDTITVLTGPGIQRGATCGLGEFQPVKLAAH